MRPIDADAIDWTLIEEEYEARTPAVVACQSLIQNAPTIDHVRHGRWLYTEAWPHMVYCSECYKTYAQKQWEVWEDGSLPRAYCPYCGAKMDE